MVAKLAYRGFHAVKESPSGGLAMVETLVVQLFQAHRGQGGVAEEGVMPVVDHVLHDQHTQAVAVVVELLGLHLDVLAEGVEAQGLHGQDVLRVALRGGGGIEAVAPVALIQQSVEEVGLAVETEAGDAVHLFDLQGAKGEVGPHLVLPRFYRELVEIGILGTPQARGWELHGGFPVGEREGQVAVGGGDGDGALGHALGDKPAAAAYLVAAVAAHGVGFALCRPGCDAYPVHKSGMTVKIYPRMRCDPVQIALGKSSRAVAYLLGVQTCGVLKKGECRSRAHNRLLAAHIRRNGRVKRKLRHTAHAVFLRKLFV